MLYNKSEYIETVRGGRRGRAGPGAGWSGPGGRLRGRGGLAGVWGPGRRAGSGGGRSDHPPLPRSPRRPPATR